MSAKVVAQGSLNFIVLRDHNNMVSWVLKGQRPDTPEYILSKGGPIGNIKDALAHVATESYHFIMKRTSR